uniref:Ephrin RBD domain-containing protein n=1 Tax=Heterorhabditis bacteriophora TaxID=37862 RepID=A0A1I7XJ07_HETBA
MWFQTMYAIFIFIVGTTLALQRVSYYDVYWNSTNPL